MTDVQAHQTESTRKVERSVPTIRRFELPDVDRHGQWVFPRLRQAYPHLDDIQLASWLRSVIYHNEFLFLFQERGVALAQAVRPDVLVPRTVVWEKFIWVPDPKDREQVSDAALFYARFENWARSLDAETIVIEERTDVPRDLIRRHLGTIMERKQAYTRVREK